MMRGRTSGFMASFSKSAIQRSGPSSRLQSRRCASGNRVSSKARIKLAPPHAIADRQSRLPIQRK